MVEICSVIQILGWVSIGYLFVFGVSMLLCIVGTLKKRFDGLVNWLAYYHPNIYKEWVDHRERERMIKRELRRPSHSRPESKLNAFRDIYSKEP